MVKALSLLSLIRGLSLLSLVRGLSLTGSRRLELGDLVIPLMMAVMEEREEDATLAARTDRRHLALTWTPP